MKSVTIRIIDYPLSLQDAYKQDELVFLDLGGPEFTLRISRLVEQLTQLNKITQESALSFSIPYSAKNDILLERYSVNILDREPEPISIEVYYDGQRVHFEKLRVVEHEDGDQQYEVEIFGGGWIDDLDDLTLQSVDLGNFEYTLANVISAWGTPTSIVYPAVIHYGAWNTPGEVTRKDLRFWFNGLKVLQKAFAKIGWTFRSTYFEALAGSRIYAYLSGEKWFSYTGKGDSLNVQCGITSQQSLTGQTNILVLDEISDPLNLYNNVLGEYSYPDNVQSPTYFNIRVVDMVFTLPPPPSGEQVGQLFFGISKNGIQQFIHTELFETSLTETLTHTINASVIDDNCVLDDTYSVWVGYENFLGDQDNIYPFTVDSGDVYFEPDRAMYIDDDTIPLNELIDERLTALDLLKGLSHYIDGRFETNFTLREVWLYPPETITQLDEKSEGFYLSKSAPQDITDKVLVDSRKVKVLENKQSRYVELKFQNSSDAFIESKELKTDPFSRRVDLGKGKSKTDRLTNPLFSPTMEVQTTASEVGTGLTYTPYVPALWDNTDGEISSNIKPRIGFCYGLVEQYDADGNTTQIIFEGTTRDDFGYITQVPRRSTSSSHVVHVAYGTYGDDAYNLFYKFSLSKRFPPNTLGFLLWIDYANYVDYSFRKPFGFYYKGVYLVYQLLSIRDFKLGGSQSTPSEFITLD